MIGRDKNRLGYADAFNRVRQCMDNEHHYAYGQKAAQIEPVLTHEIEGKQSRDDGAPHVDRHHRALPAAHFRNNVSHAPERDRRVGLSGGGGQLVYRDVHVAAEEREDQQREHVTPPDADPLIGIPEDADLDQNNEKNEKEGEQEQKRQRYREVMHGRFLDEP